MNPHPTTMIRSRKSPANNSSPVPTVWYNEIEGSPVADGKEKRQLFPARYSSKNVIFLVSLVIATNLATCIVMYKWMSTSHSLDGKELSSITKLESSPSSSCPQNMVEFANWFGDTLDSKRKAAFQSIRIKDKKSRKAFTPVPSKYRKTFFYDGKKISQPIARAFRSRNWTRVDDTDNAHVIYTYSNNADWAADLYPWQRFNYIPGLEKWNQKLNFVYYYKQYEQATGKAPSVYVPESYMLTETKEEIEAFRHVLEKKNGKNHPWVHKLSNVNQGRGITIMAPNSPALLGLPEESLRAIEGSHEEGKQQSGDEKEEDSESEDDEAEDSIIQRYICNEMTWNQRKFDVRMYWFVASLDPLIVLYHDGYVRVGNAAYSEKSFSDTTSHLTSHTGLGAETKATFEEFEAALNDHQKQKQRQQNAKSMPRRGSRAPKPFPNGNTPVEHVRNQFKHALGEMIEIMKDESFVAPKRGDDSELTTENSFQFYCADFILDNDLDVWFIEPQNGCGLDEDYYFRLEMHASLFNGMVDTLEEIGQKQERREPLLPLEKSGNW